MAEANTAIRIHVAMNFPIGQCENQHKIATFGTLALEPRSGTLVSSGGFSLSKFVVLVGFTGLTLAAAAAGACSSSTGGDGDNTLPARTEAGADTSTTTTGTDAAPAESCANLTLVVGAPAICDQCAKSKCCEEVLACTKSADCTALQECIAPCAQDDFICIGTCSEAHSKGAALLQEVGSCAKSACKTECAAAEPDAGDPFADSGL
jgi:hypothetical protein